MSECKTFHGMSQAIFNCVKKASKLEHGTVYDPPNADKGTATTDTAVGKVVLSFDLNTSTEAIIYCITSKPFLAPSSAIFNGISDTINSCRKK